LQLGEVANFERQMFDLAQMFIRNAKLDFSTDPPFCQIAVMRSGLFSNKFKINIMTQEEIEENKVVQLCYDHLDKFTDIYPKDKNADGLRWENKMPENVKLTVYCEGSEDEGFLINVKSDELGLQAFIAKKWIIHSELEALAGRSLA
jgi:hypothetical protein